MNFRQNSYIKFRRIMILLMALVVQSAIVYYKFEIKPKKTPSQSELKNNEATENIAKSHLQYLFSSDHIESQ